MRLTLQTRLFLMWLVLTAITLFAWWMGAHHGKGPLKPDAAVAFGAISVTLIKVRVIMREFMDLRHAPVRLKRITDAWLIAFAGAMTVAYIL